MALSLDGNTSFIGTEFIKLLNTGSSDLATVEYVDEQVALGGGGGGNVDLSNYYTQTEVDTLLNNKLNVNNPQDIIGNLRLDSTNGNSKLIINAVSPPNATDDFYCNGNGHFNGTLRASVLTSDGDVNCDGVNADTFNSNVVSNDIVFNHNDNEYLRFQLSDNTVRVPNTRSFLSQNIFTDIVKPLAISNDISLQGQNTTDDGYEEYVKVNSTDKTVDFNKIVNFDENVVMKQNKILYLDNTANLQRYITTRRDNAQDILELVNNKATNNQIRFTNNGSTSVIVDNSFLFSERQIQGNNGLKVDFIDTRNTNVSFQFRRAGSTLLTLNTSNQIQLSGDLSLPTSNTQYIRFPNCNIRQGVATVVYFDFNVDTATGQYRFFIDSNTILNLTPLTTTISNTLQVNTLNSSGDNTLNIQQNGNTFISLLGDALNRVQINRFLRVVDGGGSTQCHFVESTNGNYMDFRLGNHINAYASGASSGNTLHLNYYSHGDVFLGTNQDTTPDPIPTISINKFSSGTGNALEVGGNSIFYGDITTNDASHYVYTNNLRHNTGTNLNIWTLSTTKFYSNAINKMEIKQTQIDINEDVVFASGKGLTVPEIFTYNYDTNGALGDVIWAYNNTSYMYYDQSDTRFGFLVDIISNNNISCLSLTETSDKRLKDNIEDVDEDCSEIVKKVRVKTYNMKGDDKKKNHIGFIAQEVVEILPKKFEATVSDSGEHMGINYGKMTSILWKALQETLTKVEHLEASVYELQEELKDSKKPKAKSKAKSKPEK